MPSFVVQNPKGMFGNPYKSMIVSQHGFSVMKDTFNDESNPITKKLNKTQKEKLSKAFALMEDLSVGTHYVTLFKNDAPNLVKTPPQPYSWDHGYGAKRVACLEITSLGNFSSTSGSLEQDDLNISREEFWSHLSEQAPLAQYSSTLALFAKQCEVSFSEGPLKTLKKALKAFEDGEYTFKDIDLATELGEVEACVVFLPARHQKDVGGYLDGKGGTSPLSGARLFESQGAALRTINAQRRRDAVILKIKAQLVEVQEEIGSSDFERTRYLREAISRIEKKNIEQALENATIEQLQKRLARYEDVKEQDNKPPSKKRAM